MCCARHDRRGRLEGHAEVDRLAVRDAALDAAAPVGARADAVAVHVELVVVLAPGQLRAGEARADLESLARRQAQHRLGEVRLEAVEDRLAPAGRAAAHRATTRPPSEFPSFRAASTAAIIRSAIAGSGQRIGVRLDLLACDRARRRTPRRCGRPSPPRPRPPRPTGRAGASARSRPRRRGPRSRARSSGPRPASRGPRTSRRRCSRRGSGGTSPAHLAVVAGAHVLVLDLERDGRPERLALEDAAQDADGVGLLALAREQALPRAPPVEVGLDVGLGERQARGAAVDHGADGRAVGLAPRGHAEELAEGVAHRPRAEALDLDVLLLDPLPRRHVEPPS